MIKQITSILLLSIGMMANAQNKDVKIIKKTSKNFTTKIDTNTNGNIDTNINLSIMIDGDKITINGQPADKNDPRLKIMGKPHLNKMPGRKNKQQIIVDDFIVEPDPNEMEEGSDDTMDMLMQEGPKPNTAFLGVITEATEKGAKVNTVSEDSPAEKAGLHQDDIITKLNDQVIDGPKALYEAVGKCKPDEKVTIQILRNDKATTINAVLAKNKANELARNFNFKSPNGQFPNMGRGFRISPDQNFNFEMPSMNGLMYRMDGKPKMGFSIEDLAVGEGVKITAINEGSPAEKAGLKKNDIIITLNGKKVKDVDAIMPAFKAANEGSNLHLQVKREKETKDIDLVIPKKIKSADL